MGKMVEELNVWALAADPVYIGTGGYTIGRVDNTIVRDPLTRVPKIPGTALAGNWRYYVTLEILKYFKDENFRINKSSRNNKKKEELFADGCKKYIKNFEGNRYIGIKCAGKDDEPNADYEEARTIETGHCGHCLVCQGFGFSKAKKSWQGMIYFSDLHILFFPVFTVKGTRWITTMRILEHFGLLGKEAGSENSVPEKGVILIDNDMGGRDGERGYLNLGWLYLPYQVKNLPISLELLGEDFLFLQSEDIVIVPEPLFSNIVNSNLEVRTSVAIDPITGAAKEKALFTSEAIPRGTVLGGNIRIFDKSCFGDKSLPDADMLKEALEDASCFFSTLGIGGMATRGFGLIKVKVRGEDGKQEISGGREAKSEGGGKNGEK